MLLIPLSLWRQLIAWAKIEAPRECCGYLLGEMRGERNYVCCIYPMRNIHTQPTEHFTFSPQEQLKVLRTYAHLQIVGIYHSHPCSNPIPSQEDQDFMFFQTYSHLIISLKDGITFASYRKIKEKLLKESVILKEHFLKYN